MKTINVAINRIKNLGNTRSSTGGPSMKELCQSVKDNGIMTPLWVAKKGTGFVLVAGARRLEAAGKMGLKTVPVNVVEGNDQELTVFHLIENIQREDLSVYELGKACDELRRRHKMEPSEIAVRLAKPLTEINTALSVASSKIPEEIKGKIVSFNGRDKKKKKGGIPSEAARYILDYGRNVSRSGGKALSKESITELLKFAGSDKGSLPRVRAAVQAAKQGMEVKQAIKKADKVQTVNISLTLDKSRVARMEKATGKSINTLLRKVITSDRSLSRLLFTR